MFLTVDGGLKYFEDGLFKKFNMMGVKFLNIFGMRQNIYAITENKLLVIDFGTINYKLASDYQVYDFPCIIKEHS